MWEKLFKFTWEEFRQGQIGLAAPHVRWELAVLAVAVAVAAAWFFYRRSGLNRRGMRGLLAGLRGLALGILALILFEPVLRSPQPRTQDCYLAVLVDDSRSMRIEDAGPKGASAGDKAQRKRRIDLAKEVLGAPVQAKDRKPDRAAEGLLGTMVDICPVKLFKFASQTEQVLSPQLEDVTAAGERTNLFSALKTVDGELQGVPLVGIVLLTDGSYNAGGIPNEMADHLRTKDRPIYCIGIGDPQPPNDLEVLRVQAPLEVRANTEVEVYATVRNSGLKQPFQVILRKNDNSVLAREEVTPTEESQVHRVRLLFTSPPPGTLRCQVEIPPLAEEVIRDNNRHDLFIRVADKRLPVLYLEGSPREEYRFLRRALYRDKDFRIVSLLRTEGPKRYIIQGSQPEDGLEEATQGTKKNGFPEKPEHLARFEAIIFGDIEAGYLSKEQLEMTEKFVREGGRGFLMLGGVNSFNLGNYQGTVIEKMLPIVLPAPNVGYQQVEFNLTVTEDGLKHPVMQQAGQPMFNRSIWSKAPTLIGYNPVVETKLAATVLAMEPKSKTPVLVVQKYGAGKSAAFTTGGSWHWRMAVPKEDELHEKFWRQFVRWLAVGSRSQLTVDLEKDIFALKDPVVVKATVLDDELKPIDDAELSAEIRIPLKEKPDLLGLQATRIKPGVYAGQYEPTEPGSYEVQVTAKLPATAGKEKKELKSGVSFFVGETLDEFNDAGQKTNLLKELASRSGGQYVEPAQAGKIVSELKQRAKRLKRDQTLYKHFDLWDNAILFGVLACALSLEWVLRRRSGLM